MVPRAVSRSEHRHFGQFVAGVALRPNFVGSETHRLPSVDDVGRHARSHLHQSLFLARQVGGHAGFDLGQVSRDHNVSRCGHEHVAHVHPVKVFAAEVLDIYPARARPPSRHPGTPVFDVVTEASAHRAVLNGFEFFQNRIGPTPVAHRQHPRILVPVLFEPQVTVLTVHCQRFRGGYPCLAAGQTKGFRAERRGVTLHDPRNLS